MRNIINKKGLEFSFGWLFALIVGGAILFLAIYATVKIISSERAVQETEAAKQLEIILTPVETGYEEGKSVAPIVFPTETRIYNNCSTDGNFGEQSLRAASSLNLGKTWQEEGVPVTSYNKYIFSPSMMQGKEIYAFSKPFEMPFKIANLLFMWSDSYCFINPPTEVEREINSLGLKKINISEDITACPNASKKVCFVSDLEKCDVFVDPLQKSAVHRGKRIVFYEGSLIYGAIFSEPEVYECQVKRLMKRASELSLLYNAKSEGIAARANGCSSDLQPELQALAAATGNINKSGELRDISFAAGELGSKNAKIASCRLWSE